MDGVEARSARNRAPRRVETRAPRDPSRRGAARGLAAGPRPRWGCRGFGPGAGRAAQAGRRVRRRAEGLGTGRSAQEQGGSRLEPRFRPDPPPLAPHSSRLEEPPGEGRLSPPGSGRRSERTAARGAGRAAAALGRLGRARRAVIGSGEGAGRGRAGRAGGGGGRGAGLRAGRAPRLSNPSLFAADVTRSCERPPLPGTMWD